MIGRSLILQITRTLDDSHPDACASRLKLVMSVVYSANRPKWDVHEQMNLYISKTSRVSAACRLTPDEELLCIHQCKQVSEACRLMVQIYYLSFFTALTSSINKMTPTTLTAQVTPLIKNRLAYLETFLGKSNRDTLSEPGYVSLKGETPRFGGQPWTKMQQFSLEYLNRTAAVLERIHYNQPPGALADADLLKTIWEDELVMDEASGSNRQLGFAFLYEVSLGHVQTRLGQDNVNASYSQLMARFVHNQLRMHSNHLHLKISPFEVRALG